MTSVWPILGAFLGRFGAASGMRRSPSTATSVHRSAVEVVRPSAAHAKRQDCPGKGRSMKNRRQLPPFLIRPLRHLHRVCLARSSDRAGCLYRTSTILREKRRMKSAPARSNCIRAREARLSDSSASIADLPNGRRVLQYRVAEPPMIPGINP